MPGLWLFDPSGAVKIEPGNISFCHHRGDLTKIVYASGYHTSVRVSLKMLEEKLRKKNFFRCHRNYLINIDHALEGTLDKDVLKFPGRHTVPVARRKKAQLLLKLDQITRGRDVSA